MSSKFKQIFRLMRRDLCRQQYTPIFEEARERHPSLANHTTVASVLGVMANEHRGAYPEKEYLARALIAERQASRDPFWASVLLVAFYPMLSRFRFRIDQAPCCPDDLDQMVLTTFLTVVEEYPLDQGLDRTAMELRQRTQRQVFKLLQEDQRYSETVINTPPEELDVRDAGKKLEHRSNRCPGPRNPRDAAEAISLLLEHGGGVLDGETFELVTATMICGKKLIGSLRRLIHDRSLRVPDPLYQRVKRRHNRAVAELRSVFENSCPRNCPPMLCLDEGMEPEEVTER